MEPKDKDKQNVVNIELSDIMEGMNGMEFEIVDTKESDDSKEENKK